MIRQTNKKPRFYGRGFLFLFMDSRFHGNDPDETAEAASHGASI